ncbi:hypothetical protein [Sulfobacillus sp. hq2]|uniref:hypothetical protein n=1 Tax=Sulfobacillus TaxID=28033 RepID=UPI000CD1C610|nr:hypothetical protein [Sulfobacillus sp. hq2]POB11164.1 hypothetical protein CO251_06380 [Sulfobacillus sp. hq2]
MGLLISGIVESLVALILGIFLLVGEPSLNPLWGYGLIVVGVITGLLTLAFGRQGHHTVEQQVTPEETTDADATTPAVEKPQRSLPAYRTDENTGLVPVTRHLPQRIDVLREEVSRARWRYKAKEIQSRAAEMAELVLQGSDGTESVDERPRQLRRLLELFILSQGYEAWANGTEPEFHVDRYRRVLSAADIRERLEDLRAEADMLWQEISRGVPPKAPEEDAYRQTIDIRIRLERITAAEERLEEIEILRLGYQSLLESEKEEGE